MKRSEGFSLVELLLVVAILGIVMAIGIPGLLASRRAANESSAMGNLRTIDSAQAAYLAQTSYSGGFANLTAASLLDVDWSSGSFRAGYVYTEVSLDAPAGLFHITAVPSSPSTGTKSYSLVEDHVVRYTSGSVSLGSGAGIAIGS
jgi:prepilin-type N-terminal cleavage/methylation domain-containing protein